MVVEPLPNERIDDFLGNRTWAKGSHVLSRIERDAEGDEILVPYLVFGETAFDGRERMSINPKERIDPKAGPRELKIPVEVHRFRLTEKSKDPEFDKSVYPLYFAEGSRPSPDQPLTTRHRLRPFEPKDWRISGSAPNAEGEHEEYTLRPDLHFVPGRWACYSKGRPTLVTSIEYLPLEGLRPRLKSWNVRTYYHGVLIYEDSYAVEKHVELKTVDDSQFKLKPKDGMILWDLNDMKYRIAGNEADIFDTPQEANDFLKRYPPR
jgi:hypothetical protein